MIQCLRCQTPTIADTVQTSLQAILANPTDLASVADVEVLKKRKLIAQKVVKSINVSKGPSFALVIVKPNTELTADMLADGSWKTLPFKKLNLDALGKTADAGCLHPMLKVRAEYREIFLQMGFTEMPTNNFVERFGGRP